MFRESVGPQNPRHRTQGPIPTDGDGETRFVQGGESAADSLVIDEESQLHVGVGKGAIRDQALHASRSVPSACTFVDDEEEGSQA